MFQKLLIANRGEVAVRIARAAKALGIRTVCAVSSADRLASWTGQFDELVVLGPSAARDSYLRADAVVQAALQTRCSAVHPGWGFLAEKARFAYLCQQHGLAFVGPSPRAIELMGRKAPAKAAMREAGVPVIPGSLGLLDSLEAALAAARECGYPVILKADAGGGGKGMRRCDDEGELRRAWPAASAEAQSAFGSGALYLERYLEGGRHVEVQVLGDRFGGAVHLFERDCSVQRNHQKLIEEGPCPLLSSAERAALGERAAAAARSIGYVGAGTIEFLRGSDGALYFMEMNTRLQVEHPVTELITGVDIVQEQLRLAGNARLTLAQERIELDGHAVEVRLNAEDPSHGFRPSPGKLRGFQVPLDLGPGRVRVDTHLAEGDEISPHYDSLLAKVLAHGRDRNEAIETLLRALRAARIEGVRTTLPLFLTVLDHSDFRAGRYDTRAIPGWRPAAAAAS
jgi:acetyl-CoA carboxylase biotin carboxylase subunit